GLYFLYGGWQKSSRILPTFAPLKLGLASVEVRAFLFERAPVSQIPDLFQLYTRADLLQQAAQHFQTKPATIEAALFADHPNEAILTDLGIQWTPTALLNRPPARVAPR
ncbi:MAG: DUF790 family protein, partial [Blastochloris sp.]|nr:DUF790 family protein [Blastochloris sp.]